MTTASLIIVADRGRLKAYRVRETPTRGPSLELVQAFGIPNLNDLSHTHRTTAASDWPQLEIEENRQICRQLADEIANLVRRDFGEGWSLAAPESIYNMIVDLLPGDIRDRIVEHLALDLSKIPVGDLLSHFRSLQPI
ncbi:MAG TPA: host attachment protein [Chthoniobacterales bacterium]|nr:host attachment protein [Chthoniobacterales bacterium]